MKLSPEVIAALVASSDLAVFGADGTRDGLNHFGGRIGDCTRPGDVAFGFELYAEQATPDDWDGSYFITAVARRNGTRVAITAVRTNEDEAVKPTLRMRRAAWAWFTARVRPSL